ncbi:hypothetical protein AB6M97_09740 [Streptococcus hillyeri]|uniref:Adhesin domain-containing protein n=1 Tax=Streptococcus hillyeri TaxID=2282420 RepID=A0A3L9DRK1_9STRE|nr:hypothetical protein [Streptococcus hillyeri]RLY03585.1 hypothetical protein EAF07_04705 [Streptococcus hillyeri]
MKRKILIGLAAFLVIGLAGLVWTGVQNDKTDVSYDKTFTVPAKNINVIHVSSLEQPAKVVVKESEQAKTSVHITGQMAQNNIAAMEKQFGIDEEGDLMISFAEDGLTLTVMRDKPTVTIEITLAKDVTFNDFRLFSSNGGADITLPKSFDGRYKITSQSNKITKPQNGTNKKRQASIETPGDVNVVLE